MLSSMPSFHSSASIGGQIKNPAKKDRQRMVNSLFGFGQWIIFIMTKVCLLGLEPSVNENLGHRRLFFLRRQVIEGIDVVIERSDRT